MTSSDAIKHLKSAWRTIHPSQVNIQKISTWFVDNYYIVIRFAHKGKVYEYREDASDRWVEECA